jgi:hypothetical protein
MLHRHRFAPDTETSIVDELVAVLTPHPAGLRRWSVMNAIRRNRQSASRDIPLKLEAEVERAFRAACMGDGARAAHTARFRRPSETAGEVWALNPAYNPAAPADTETAIDAAASPTIAS